MAESEWTACLGGRRDRVRSLLDARGLDAIILRRFANFAWYTDGADNRVDHSSPFGVAGVVVTRDADFILTDSIEAGRLRAEVAPAVEVVEHPWYEPLPLLRLVGSRAGSDGGLHGTEDMGDEIAMLRRALDTPAIARYRSVGADTVAAVTETAGQLAPGMTEWEMMALLEAACRRRGLFSPVAMAAADDRSERFRHPVTAGATARRRVMIVVCAERGGLYANMTAWVHFEKPDGEWRRRQRACESILRRLREEVTAPGTTLAEVFHRIAGLYAEEGFPDQWRYHHQGGMTGYATREVVATPQTRDEIEIGQAFAWNPSITGAKAEETFVLTAAGPEVLAAAGGTHLAE